MGTIHESLKFPLCDCPAVVEQYQKTEWKPYIKYCQNIEKSMQYSAAGITVRIFFVIFIVLTHYF